MGSIAQAAQAVKTQISAQRTPDGRWQFAKTRPGGLTRHSTATWETEAEALLAGGAGFDQGQITIRTSSEATRWTLIAGWQQEGIDLARHGFGPEHCTNGYQRQGWESVRGVPVFGWPQPQMQEAA